MNPLVALFLAIFESVKAIFLYFVPSPWLWKDISGDTVLITGGGSGLGQQMAVKFAQLGVRKIVLWDLSRDGLQRARLAVEGQGATCFTYVVDVTDRNAVYETAKLVERDTGHVTILVNNAGVVSGQSFLTVPDEKILQTFHVNVISHFWTIKAFLPGMVQLQQGHLVSIASMAGIFGTAGLTDYSASKFAAIGLEEALRVELRTNPKTQCIRSTVVCPYFINTGMFHGVTSTVLPLLETDYVANKIISAIRLNREVLQLPKITYLLSALKAIFPAEATWLLSHYVVKTTVAMDTFIGRKAGSVTPA
ncbi:Short-chain dehydrogenase/reductase family 16C member 6 [Halotydeus destructor]|nr:Short-chain dehydrogenase/reductase family 16C member 6 [Halotydeus destructor]